MKIADIYKGKNVAIIGRNGGGKSTLVKLMLGFLKKKSIMNYKQKILM